MMKTIKLSELFDIEYGTNLALNKCEEDENGVNFVSRTSKNNGVSAKIKRLPDKEPIPAGTISVALGGTVLETFLQSKEYYSGRDIAYLTPKKEMTDREKLYYCICIKANKFKYSYGRQANKTLPDLLVPSEIPDWVYTVQAPDIKQYREQINKYLRNENGKLMIKPDKLYDLIKSGFFDKNESFNDNQIPELDTSNWKEFKLTDLFEIKGSKTTKLKVLKEIGPGEYPYITTKSTNNGVDGYYDIWTEEGNVLTIDSACIGTCFYQEKNFTAADHVEKLIPKFKMNKYNALFLVTVINQSNFKYCYGRGRSQSRLAKETIKLPATEDGQPDYQFMEDYIKTLPYSKHI